MRNKELTLEITEWCDIGCRWCSTSASPTGSHVPLDQIKETLREQEPYCDVVRLSGGEPVYHPDLREILWYAKCHLRYKVVLLTNGQHTLGVTMRDDVDEFIVSIVNPYSFQAAIAYNNRVVSLHVVSVEGNEHRIVEAIAFAYEQQIPLHILALQKQGRGVNCESSNLITWTGQKGCTMDEKVTVTPNGNVVTCSALKGGTCSLRDNKCQR